MRPSVQILILVVVAVLLVFAGRRWERSVAEPVTITKYRDRPLAPKDSSGGETPEVKIIYRTRVDTVLVEVPVPANFRFTGLIARRPLRYDGNRAILTYWSPSDSRMIQDVYKVPKSKWGAYAAARGVLWPEFGLGVEMGLRYRMVGLFASADAFRNDYHVSAGVRLFAWGR